MFVQEVPDVDAHADVFEPGPFVGVRMNLLFGVAVGVVHEVLGLVGGRNGEGCLYEELGSEIRFVMSYDSMKTSIPGHWTLPRPRTLSPSHELHRTVGSVSVRCGYAGARTWP